MRRVHLALLWALALCSLLSTLPAHANLYLRDTGWWDDSGNPVPATVATWDSTTQTGTLQADVNQQVTIESDNVTLEGNGKTLTVPETWGTGVWLAGRMGVTIRRVTVIGGETGVHCYGDGNTIEDTTVIGNYYGIRLEWGSKNTAKRCTARANAYYGVYLYSASLCTLTSNTIDGAGDAGIYLGYSSTGNVLTDNAVTSCRTGISLYSAPGNTLTGNTLSGNRYNFSVQGWSDDDYKMDVDTTNTVDGKPIYYLVAATDRTIDAGSNAGVVYLINCTGITVQEVTLTHNDVGIWLRNTTKSRVDRVTATENLNGVVLTNSSGNTVTGCTANDNETFGIWLTESAGKNKLTGNSTAGNQDGIMLDADSSENGLSGNTANGNRNRGIVVQNSNGNILAANVASANQGEYDGAGIALYVASATALEKNKTNSNSRYGIAVFWGCENAKLIGNTAVKNGECGIYMDSVNASTLTNNITNDNRHTDEYGNEIGDGIRLLASSGNSLEKNSAKGNARGIAVSGGTGNTLTSNTASGNSDTGIALEWATGSTLTGNFAGASMWGMQFYAAGGNTLTRNTLRDNCYNFAVDGWSDEDFANTIDTTNTVDGKPIYYLVGVNGGTINASSNAGTVYLINCANITLQSLALARNGSGVFLWNTQHSRLLNITTTDNHYGVYVRNSGNNTLIANTLTGNGTGMLLENCTGNLVTANAASESDGDEDWGAGGYGIALASSTGNKVFGNTASNNYGGLGLFYSGGNTLSSNRLAGNQVNFFVDGWADEQFANDINVSNTVDGKPIYYLVGARGRTIGQQSNAGTVYLVGCADITVRDLTLAHNGSGVFLWNTTGSSVTNVTVSESLHGIALCNATENTLTNNKADANREGGFILDSASNNVLTGNSATRTLGQGTGFSLIGSSGNTLEKNLANDNATGILLLGSNDNTLVKNTVEGNAGNGISLEWWATGNKLMGNLARGNAMVGVFLNDAGGSELTENTTTENGWGIVLTRSGNSTLVGNTMADNNYNLFVEGWSEPDFLNTIDTSNTVDGSPVLYLQNETERVIDGSSNAGTVYLINCANMVVRDLELGHSGNGILLWNTTDSRIEKVTAKDCYRGIVLAASNRNTVTGCHTGSTDIGMVVSGDEYSYWYGANENSLDSNAVAESRIGITLNRCSSNTLSGNQITRCAVAGVQLSDASGNTMADNAIAGSKVGVDVSASGSYWGWGSSENILADNKLMGNATGIALAGADWWYWGVYSNRLTGNTVSGSTEAGIRLERTSSNDLLDNTVSDGETGIVLGSDANDNTARYNTIARNATGLHIDEAYGNLVYGNNFDTNGTQASVIFRYGNRFAQPFPIGGNFWSNWAPPAHPDTNGDGFVDAPYLFDGGYGLWPLAKPTIYETDPPEVTITTPADGAAYLVNEPVTADWSAVDTGSGLASVAASIPDGDPLDTSVPGGHWFTVTAVDRCENTTTVTYRYQVKYKSATMEVPADPVPFGPAVEVKVRVLDYYDAPVSTASIYLSIIGVNGERIEAVSADGTWFVYDEATGQYVFQLATDPSQYWDGSNLPRNSWQLVASLNDSYETPTEVIATITFIPPPQVTITTPPNGAQYLLNEPVTVDWSVTDTEHAIASVEASAPDGDSLDTTQAFWYEFVVTATNDAGSRATATAYYSVVYKGGEVQVPTDPVERGSVVPVGFQLLDYNDAPVGSAGGWVYIVTPDGWWVDAISADSGGSTFTYDAATQRYIFNLVTDPDRYGWPLSGDTWQLYIVLDDWTTRQATITFAAPEPPPI